MTIIDWLQLFAHFSTLSLLSVGGAMTATPSMHHYLVDQQHWLTSAQFNASIAIAQAAPGPNILFVALMGWQVGLNSGNLYTGLLGMSLTMIGIMAPSTILTLTTARWVERYRNLRSVRAFKQGMAPIVIGMLLSTGWIMASVHSQPARDWPLWLTTAITALIIWHFQIHLLWLLGAGAVLGWYGLL